MARDYVHSMKSLQDADLIRICSEIEPGAYESAAVEAAKAELASRNISTEDYDDAICIIKEGLSEELNRETLPLGVQGRILAVIFCFAFVPMVIAIMVLYARGLKKKASDALMFMVIGWLLWMTVFAMIFVITDIASA